MPYILGPRDYCWLIPKGWVIQYRHPSGRQVDLFVRTRRIKLEFTCVCDNVWTSMEGCLRIFIWLDEEDNHCICIMMYQEDCKECGETPTKVNVVPNRKEFATLIKKVIYDYQHPNKRNPLDVAAAKGKPKGPHLEEHCEACRKRLH